MKRKHERKEKSIDETYIKGQLVPLVIWTGSLIFLTTLANFALCRATGSPDIVNINHFIVQTGLVLTLGLIVLRDNMPNGEGAE
ncbi:MAG: hypothetical protein KAJ40_02355 [Alphaproteobacteria bacterium]|nr:hypothetical protein [Alphaproteobacteria bacterium]